MKINQSWVSLVIGSILIGLALKAFLLPLGIYFIGNALIRSDGT